MQELPVQQSHLQEDHQTLLEASIMTKFAVAARADTASTAKHKELEKAMGALNKFKDGVQLKIAELEFLPLDLENKEEIQKELVAMGGCKEMQKRFQPMLGK